MRQRSFLIVLAFTIGWCLYSCKEYTDDLRDLGGRVEALEDTSLKFFDIEKSIKTLKFVAETYGYVTSIEQRSDGTYIIHLKGYFNGSDVLTDSTVVLRMGEDGAELSDLLTIKKYGDIYCWWFYDDWLYDEFHNPIPVQGMDGKNGEDLDTSSGNYIPPMLKIDVDGNWLVSYDGGNTWINTGKSSKGEKGKADPIVKEVKVTENYLILKVMINGIEQTITLPRKQQ